MELAHNSLDARIKGVKLERDGIDIAQYRGLQYGTIVKRFASPTESTIGDTAEKNASNGPSWCIDATKFGPQCPQQHSDIRHLMCIPAQYPEERYEQDEHRCLNLTITTPAKKYNKKLPVLFWIHGGSQVKSICGPASRCSDTTLIVADSAKMGKPVIVVGINYRLNIFAFGNGKGEKNLALKDQRCAINWVVKYIGDFGGDRDNITMAGESAGGLYTHCHSIIGTPARRVILQSGNLPLSPPSAPRRSEALIQSFEDFLKNEYKQDLQNAPVEALVKGLEKLKINSIWLDLTPELEGWQNKEEKVEEMMIGDCEFESILWMEGIRQTSVEEIVECFNRFQGEELDLLKSMYCIEETLPKACKRGALDFINDFFFAEPVVSISNRMRATGKTVYQYAVDEPNPWQASAGAHHGVDLLWLFGDYDFSKHSYLNQTAAEMRKRWIIFVNGEKPWDGLVCAFGPRGICDELGADSITNHRRWHHLQLLGKLRPRLNTVAAKLVAGKIHLGD